METVLPDAQRGEAGTLWVYRMKGTTGRPYIETETVLTVSGCFQRITGKPEMHNSEKVVQSGGMFEKITARS